MNIETVFTRWKCSEQSISNFLSYLIWLNYLNAEQQTDTLCDKINHSCVTMCFLNWKIFFKDTICLLFKEANWKLIMSRFPETIVTTQNTCLHTRAYIFAQWLILQDKKLPVPSHYKLKAQFITTGNNNRDKFCKKTQFQVKKT